MDADALSQTAVLTSTSSALAEYPLNLPGWDVDEDLDMVSPFPISLFIALVFANITQHVTVDERLPINTLRVVDASRVVNDVCMFDEPRVVTNQRLIIKDNQRLYDLPRLFNGPQIIIGRGKEPHIIDLTSVFMWYELSFTVGTDDTINSAELWDWMANTIANPPVPGIFEQEHERRSVVIGLINEVYEANAYGHGDYSTLYRKVEVQRKNGSWTIDMEFGEKTPKEQKEIVTKWLSKLKKEDDRLTHRPHSWIVRLADYDHIVHHHKFKPEADINHEDLDESLPLKVAGDAFLESLPVDSFCDMWGLLQPTTAADLTAEASSGDEEEDEVYVSAFDYDAEEDC